MDPNDHQNEAARTPSFRVAARGQQNSLSKRRKRVFDQTATGSTVLAAASGSRIFASNIEGLQVNVKKVRKCKAEEWANGCKLTKNVPRGTSITGKSGWGLAELYRGRTVSSDMMGIATSRPETMASAREGV
jgi:hypothetical protein